VIVTVDVSVGVAVSVGVKDAVAVRVGVLVGVRVGVRVNVTVGVSELVGVLLWLLADTPESRGLRSVVAFDGELVSPTDDTAPFWPALVRFVLLNRNVWAIGLVDLCVYVVRFGTLDWTSKYLLEAKHYTQAAAGFAAGAMPVAGVVGVLASGFIADWVFRGRYRTLNAVCLVALAGCLYGLWATGPGHVWVDLAFLCGIGFFVEGPQSILGGVGAVDAGGRARIASSAAGLVGVLAYSGASLSGVGSGMAIDRYGWDGALAFWIGCSLVGLLLCLTLWREARPAATRPA
jgi:sugar phosphate permease